MDDKLKESWVTRMNDKHIWSKSTWAWLNYCFRNHTHHHIQRVDKISLAVIPTWTDLKLSHSPAQIIYHGKKATALIETRHEHVVVWFTAYMKLCQIKLITWVSTNENLIIRHWFSNIQVVDISHNIPKLIWPRATSSCY